MARAATASDGGASGNAARRAGGALDEHGRSGGLQRSDSRTSGSTMGAAGTASVGVGAALAAAVASACCVGPVVAPLVVAVLGASGAAWAASLKPYSPILLTASGLLLAWAFWSIYRTRDAEACRVDVDDGAGGGPASAVDRGRLWKGLLLQGVVWGAAVLWLVSLALNLFLPDS